MPKRALSERPAFHAVKSYVAVHAVNGYENSEPAQFPFLMAKNLAIIQFFWRFFRLLVQSNPATLLRKLESVGRREGNDVGRRDFRQDRTG